MKLKYQALLLIFFTICFATDRRAVPASVPGADTRRAGSEPAPATDGHCKMSNLYLTQNNPKWDEYSIVTNVECGNYGHETTVESGTICIAGCQESYASEPSNPSVNFKCEKSVWKMKSGDSWTDVKDPNIQKKLDCRKICPKHERPPLKPHQKYVDPKQNNSVFRVGDQGKVECESPYEPIHEEKKQIDYKCTAGGLWSYSDLNFGCRQTCAMSAVAKGPNTEFKGECAAQRVFEDVTCNARCVSGYVTAANKNARAYYTCLSSGSWKIHGGESFKIECLKTCPAEKRPILERDSHQHYSDGKSLNEPYVFREGDHGEVKCNKGYIPETSNLLTYVCSNGQWNENGSTKCNQDPNETCATTILKDSFHVKFRSDCANDSFKYQNETCTATCDKKYEADGTESVVYTCKDKSWIHNGDDIKCNLKQKCQTSAFESTALHAEFKGNGCKGDVTKNKGENCKASCEKTYIAKNETENSVYVCEAGGLWEASQPIDCLKICDAASRPPLRTNQYYADARALGGSHVFREGDSASVQCDATFKAPNSATLKYTCTHEGIWKEKGNRFTCESSNAPTCSTRELKGFHAEFQEPVCAYHPFKYEGEKCKATCQPGYKEIGSKGGVEYVCKSNVWIPAVFSSQKNGSKIGLNIVCKNGKEPHSGAAQFTTLAIFLIMMVNQ